MVMVSQIEIKTKNICLL